MRSVGMSEQQVEQVWVGFRAGESLSRISRREGVPKQQVARYLQSHGGVRPLPARRSPRHLSVVARNGGRDAYRAAAADTAAFGRARRPKASKLALAPVLRAVVEAGLELEWSPEQISHRLRLDHPDDPVMRVSHETIYMAIYQPHRRAVKAKLHRQLRTGRLMRHPKLAAVPSGRGRLKNMVLLADRPAEVADRLVAGHWEGDLVMGTRPSAVATLVERTTRLLRVVALPGGIKAAPVRAALTADLLKVHPALRRSLTWDRGREMAEHAQLTTDTNCPVYFYDPRSPWQRGTNENMNRLLRQYLSKNADLRTHDQAALDAIAARLNGRPRRVLGWRTPAEAYAAQGTDTPPAAPPTTSPAC
jgi:IS30 family transposase